MFAPAYDRYLKKDDEKAGGLCRARERRRLEAGKGLEDGVIRLSSLQLKSYEGFSLPNPFDPAMDRTFQKEKFDMIHVHHPVVMGQAALRMAKKYGVPVNFTYHTRYEQYMHYLGLSALKGAVKPYIRRFADRCDCVIAPTESMREYLWEAGVNTPVKVLPTGLLQDSFSIDPVIAQGMRCAMLGEKKYLFCTAARLAKEKNLEFILESLALRKSGGKNDFIWMILGDGPQRRGGFFA